MNDHPFDGYDGPAELLVPDPAPSGRRLPVQVTLRGVFQPIDGRYHWHGRLSADHPAGEGYGADSRVPDQADPLVDELGRSGATVVLATPEGRAEGRLSDPDPWGRHRIAGVGRPPFRLDPVPAT